MILFREMVTKDIGTLRSKDSEGEKNSSLKQQLNSLLYLRKVIDNRIHRLQGEDSDSFGVPSQVGGVHKKVSGMGKQSWSRDFWGVAIITSAWKTLVSKGRKTTFLWLIERVNCTGIFNFKKS
jgi:hypothetical protein